jgi:DNA-binding transcriptional MerR regulator
MVAHQLDLFGGPLKPPKKITIDEEDVPVDASISIETSAEGEDIAISNDNTVEKNENTTDIVSSNDLEWAPDEQENTLIVENRTHKNGITNGETEFADSKIPGYLAQEPVTTIEKEVATHVEEQDNETHEIANQEGDLLPSNENFSSSNEVESEELLAPIVEVPGEEILVEPGLEDLTTDAALLETVPFSENNNETINAEKATQTLRSRKLPGDQEDDSDGLNVPPDEELFKRQYYSMRETSAMFGVNQSLLRFWENEFDVLQPKKNKKGDRYFRPVDIKNLVLIHHLLRVRKFTMDGAKDYLQSHKKAGDTFELIRRLEKLKSFLFELKAGL